jgi:hypothetical protein
MTRTTPRRFIILHFSQRLLTDGFTFILLYSPIVYAKHYRRVRISGSPSVMAIVCSK